MKLFLTLILTLAFSLQGFCTMQVPDRLIYKGDTLPLYEYPLEKHPDIDSLRKIKLFGDEYGCISSGCWRGYVGEWTIINDQLYLTGLYDGCYDSIKADLANLFGKKCVNGKVKADWVTGNFVVPKKEMFYYGQYEQELEFYFKKGKLKKTQLYDNSKAKQSEYFSDTEKLKKHIYSNINWDILPKQDTTVRVVVQFSANEDGIIDSVKVLVGHNEIYDQEAIRVVKSIPEWNVYYEKGKFVRYSLQISIVFDKYNRLKYKKEKVNNYKQDGTE